MANPKPTEASKAGGGGFGPFPGALGVSPWENKIGGKGQTSATAHE